MTREAWLRTHGFLAPVAQLLDRVEVALGDVGAPAASVPQWDAYADDYREGIPLLHSPGAAVDLAPAGELTCAAIDALATSREQDSLASEARALGAQFAGAGQRVVDFLLGDDTVRPVSAGLLRVLGWTAARRFLQPVLVSFATWRDQERWQRRHCPACGALPTMAQLVGVDPGHVRFLACGCCGSRWRFGRTTCPFCEHDPHRIEVLAVEGEGGLRIDHCGACRAYLKTYVGQGSEDVLLADWTSLHLDALAQSRGLRREAPSLYGLELPEGGCPL